MKRATSHHTCGRHNDSKVDKLQMIELNGTLKAADFARLHYAHRLRQTGPLIVAVVALTTILSLIVSLYPYSTLSVVVRFLFVILVVGITLSALSPYGAARRQLKNELYFRDPIIQRFKPIGYELEGTEFSMEVPWKDLSQVREMRTLFLMYRGPETADIVPKRFFTNQEAIDAWRRTVEIWMAPRGISKPGFLDRWL
jgi:hypothetical protein